MDVEQLASPRPIGILGAPLESTISFLPIVFQISSGKFILADHTRVELNHINEVDVENAFYPLLITGDEPHTHILHVGSDVLNSLTNSARSFLHLLPNTSKWGCYCPFQFKNLAQIKTEFRSILLNPDCLSANLARTAVLFEPRCREAWACYHALSDSPDIVAEECRHILFSNKLDQNEVDRELRTIYKRWWSSWRTPKPSSEKLVIEPYQSTEKGAQI